MRTKEDVGLKFTNNQGHRSRIEGNKKNLSNKQIPLFAYINTVY